MSMADEIALKIVEAAIPLIAKEVFRELKARLKVKLKEPNIYAVGYISAFYDVYLGYTREVFMDVFAAATGFKGMHNNSTEVLGKIYVKNSMVYAVLVETFTLEELFETMPEILEKEDAYYLKDVVTTVNVRIIPMSQDALYKFGVVLSQVAAELSKFKGAVSVKVKLFGVQPHDVKVPLRGKVVNDQEGVIIVFYDFSEPRTYDFIVKRGVKELFRSLKQRVKMVL